MPVDKEMKSKMNEKMMTAVKEDIKGAKISKRVNSMEIVDGYVKVSFSVSGLPTKKEKGCDHVYCDSYRDYSKIFKNLADFSKYAEAFFYSDLEKYE